MPRLFFDIAIGQRLARDDEGIELSSEDFARVQAETALREIAQEAWSSEPERIVLTVRNECGICIYRGECTTASGAKVRGLL